MKQKEKERSYSKDVCLWQGHWVRPHRTKFVRHIYLCDYKIHFFTLLWKQFFPVFSMPPEYWNVRLHTLLQAWACCALSQQLKQNFKGSPFNILLDLLFLNSYQNAPSPLFYSHRKESKCLTDLSNGAVVCSLRARQISQHKTSLQTSSQGKSLQL